MSPRYNHYWRQLLDWVIDKNAVVELGISTGNDALSTAVVMAALRAFPSLRKLALAQNRLGGALDGDALAPFARLDDLRLFAMGLVGAIPARTIGRELPRLRVLYLVQNELEGADGARDELQLLLPKCDLKI